MPAAALTINASGLTAAPLAHGELLVSGYLTRWDELDREGERMIRGAFAKSIPAFLAGHAPFCYGHRFRDVLGTVEALVEDDVGVKLTARVNAQPTSSPLRWVYEAIRNGTIKGLSVGARFLRRKGADGHAEVHGVDIVECSATATPVLASTGFEVVSEGKALAWGWGPLADERAALEQAWLTEATRQVNLAAVRISAADVRLTARGL